MELKDDTLIIKPFELRDALAHLAGEDAEQIRWVSGAKSTMESVEDWIRRNQEFSKSDGPVFNFAVWAGGQLVGMVEANTDVQQAEGIQKGDANISYAIYPKFRGKRYATMAVHLMLEYLKQRTLKRAVLRIKAGNIGSLRIPIACGFQEIEEIDTKEGKMLMFVKPL